jgi:hypothetical protein
MAVKKRVERPDNIIKTNIKPITTEVKVKCATAINDVIARIKVKHLG